MSTLTKVRDYFSNTASFPFIFGDPNGTGDYTKVLADGVFEVYKSAIKVGEYIYDTSYPFIVVTTQVEFYDAMILPYRASIKCEGVAVTDVAYSDINVTHSKYIHTEKENDLFIGGSGVFITVVNSSIDIEFRNKIFLSNNLTIYGSPTNSNVRFNDVVCATELQQIINSSTALVYYKKTNFALTGSGVIRSFWTEEYPMPIIEVSTDTEFFYAMIAKYNCVIKCKSVALTSLATLSVPVSYSKYIYTESESDLRIGSGSNDLYITPSNGIEIFFNNKIKLFGNIRIEGSASNALIKFNDIVCSTTQQIYNATTSSVVYQKTNYLQSQTGVTFSIWNDQCVGKIDNDTLVNFADKQVVASSGSTTYNQYAHTQEEAIGNTTDSDCAIRRYFLNGTEKGNMSFIAGHSGFSSGRHIFRAYTYTPDVLKDAMVVNGDGHLAVYDLPHNWGKGIITVDSGNHAVYDDVANGLSGESDNAYKKVTGTWYFKNAGYAKMSQFNKSTGLYQEYISSASGVADGVISWVKIYERDKLGSEAFGGASLLSSMNTAYKYNIYPNGRVAMFSLGGFATSYECYNCYYKSTNLWGLVNSAQNAYIEFTAHGATTSGGFYRSYIPSGTADGTFLSAPYSIYAQTYQGNENIKTGATRTATL
jgi:hypothetical protein